MRKYHAKVSCGFALITKKLVVELGLVCQVCLYLPKTSDIFACGNQKFNFQITLLNKRQRISKIFLLREKIAFLQLSKWQMSFRKETKKQFNA